MMTAVGVAMLLGLVPFAIGVGVATTAADKRGWLHPGNTSTSSAFLVAEEFFSPSASQSRQVLLEQRRIGQRAPTPGDGLDDGPWITGRYAGRLTITANGSRKADALDDPGHR
jgi:hypothetical protein